MADNGDEPVRRKRGRPPASQSDGRDDIKKAALREFAKTGFKGTSIDRIAEAAGVAKPLVHYHFGSKETVWKEAVGQAFDEYQTEFMSFAATVNQNRDEDVFDAFADALVRFNAEYVDLNRIVGDEIRQTNERGQWIVKRYTTPMNKLLLAALTGLLPNNPDIRRTVAHITPTIAGALQLPFLDAEIVRDAFDVDVFSEEYLKEQAVFIATLMRACLEYGKGHSSGHS